MSGDSLKIGSMRSPSPLDSPGQVLRQPGNETPFVELPVGFPTGDDEVTDIKKKLRERTSHFPRVKSIHAVRKLLPGVRIYSGFCCNMFFGN
jgi:hypothetical protein